MDANERIQAEVAVLDAALRDRDRRGDWEKTSIHAHANLASPDTRQVLEQLHDFGMHGNANTRMPFDPKIDAPADNEVDKFTAKVHRKYEDEKIIGGIAARSNTANQLAEISRRESQKPPSITELLQAQFPEGD